MHRTAVAAATIAASAILILMSDMRMTAAQPMPPSQPAVPQTMPPTQMPPEKIEPNAMPVPSPSRNLGQAPSGQPLTPGQPTSPTQPVLPTGPDMRPTPPPPTGSAPR